MHNHTHTLSQILTHKQWKAILCENFRKTYGIMFWSKIFLLSFYPFWLFYTVIPWRFVCNGHWECPGGMDEIMCSRNSCPGMFKCRNSSICLSPDNLCDSTSDCIYNEDERFCPIQEYFQECPSNCSCLLQ